MRRPRRFRRGLECLALLLSTQDHRSTPVTGRFVFFVRVCKEGLAKGRVRSRRGTQRGPGSLRSRVAGSQTGYNPRATRALREVPAGAHRGYIAPRRGGWGQT